MNRVLAAQRAVLIVLIALLSACGGGSSNSNSMSSPPPPPPVPPVPTLDPAYLASAPSPFPNGCDGAAATGTVYVNAEVEPYVVADPGNPQHLVAVWQEDRWSNGGSRGIIAAVSNDGGRTWTQQALPFTRCGGGNPGNGGDYERASNPWVTIGADGGINVIAIAFSGFVLAAGSTSAVLSVRSTDGGVHYGAASVLIADGATAFNDKDAITADPTDAHYVYAVWDRLDNNGFGPSYLARSSNGGASWEAAHAIYDPGANNQTISNAVVVLPNGTAVDMFLEIDSVGTQLVMHTGVIRSTDNGSSWSAPIKVADDFSIGTRDPDSGAAIRDGMLIPEIAVGPGGKLYVVWQDSRFTGGARDSVALSQSNDGGMTWSAPVPVNGNTGVAAFAPVVHVRGDGVIGVAYYDFRPNTTAATTLLTDFWLARSADGSTWRDSQIAGPFDLDLGPIVTTPGAGPFLGDYQGLASTGNLFEPLFTQTSSSAANRTDIFSAPAVSEAGAVSSFGVASTPRSALGETYQSEEQLRQRTSESIRASLQQRLPHAQGSR